MSASPYIPSEFNIYKEDELNQKIEYVIGKFGIGKPYTGAVYLKRAIEIVYTDPKIIHNMMSGLYKIIAAEYGTTVSCVERNCRTFISALWKSGNRQCINEYFSPMVNIVDEKPTVCGFIAVLSEKLRCESICEYVLKYAHREIS